MAPSKAAPPPFTANRILRQLSAPERERLASSGQRVHLDLGEVIQETGEEITRIYFPLSGVVSMLTVLSTGQATEVATIGREGFAGLPVFLGERISATRNLVQVPGEALMLESEVFRKEMGGGRMAILLARYAELLFASAAQSTACARLHSVDQRCARAILTWHDRLDHEILPVTQDALAEALGVRRASVTAAIKTFVEAGALRRGRARLTLTRRGILEGLACECYRTIEDAFARETG
jgi:CRP-like cAMP-binding protein